MGGVWRRKRDFNDNPSHQPSTNAFGFANKHDDAIAIVV
jgi:hypothetical protein